MIAKSMALWAEHTCVAPFEQWTVGNETYAVLLDDPDEALGRSYGEAVPVSIDVEWYATAQPVPLDHGYEQAGVVHGTVELKGGPLEIAEVPAHRTHRWTRYGTFLPWTPPPARAHFGVRAAFRFPDDSTSDLVVTPAGWRSRDDQRGTLGPTARRDRLTEGSDC